MVPWWSALSGTLDVAGDPVLQVAADGGWEDTEVADAAARPADVSDLVERVARRARDDIAVEVYWRGTAFAGARWQRDEWRAAAAAAHRVQAALPDTGGHPVQAPHDTGGHPVQAPHDTGGHPVQAPHDTGGQPVQAPPRHTGGHRAPVVAAAGGDGGAGGHQVRGAADGDREDPEVTGGRPVVAALLALVGEPPGRSVRQVDLGAVNAWRTTGPLPLWRPGDPRDPLRVTRLLGRRPDLASCRHPVAVEVCVGEPHPCWLGVVVSVPVGGTHRVDQVALRDLVAHVTTGPDP